MSSGFAPLTGPALLSPEPRRPRAKKGVRAGTAAHAPREAQRVAWCVLVLALLVELAVLLRPQALVLAPVQASVAFKMTSGYTMLALLVFTVAFGWLRRLPAMARQQRRLNELHQLAGLAMLLLLAFHAAGRPSGFLLYTFHALALGLAAGALRGVLGARAPRPLATALLTLHVSLACMTCAAVLLHLYFVYAYTA